MQIRQTERTTVLDDKSIGELWLWVTTREPDPELDPHTLSANEGTALIRKLVAERRERYAAESDGKWDSLHYTAQVLAELGIPEEDWK